MAVIISPKVALKLADRHRVTRDEIEQCFANRSGIFLEDTREEHETDPPTQWFIAKTDAGKDLKVVFIFKGKHIIIRTAYEPNRNEQYVYNKFGA